jgi:hypothetical protein
MIKCREGGCSQWRWRRSGDAGISTELLDIAALQLQGSFLVEKGADVSGGGDAGISTELLDIAALRLHR